ncbi:hypothetical protein ACIBL6_16010 [Streptomyces sp. NPDC050400]|uniref:hypothetical protein n=1 Tax=unclassified Streptomyces TaxID=2593676 RepID=UPI00355897A1
MTSTFWRLARGTEWAEHEVQALGRAMVQLGIGARPPKGICVAFRISGLSRRLVPALKVILIPASWVLCAAVLGLFADMVFNYPGEEQGEGGSLIDPVVKQVDALPAGFRLSFGIATYVPILVLAVALLAAFVIGASLMAGWPIWYSMGRQSGSVVERARRYRLPLTCAKAVQAIAKAHRSSGDRSIREYRQVCVHVRLVSRAIYRAQRTRGLLTWRSHRRKQLRRHAGQVVARLQQLEASIDVAPRAGLRELAEAILMISERYSEGKLGALLDEDEVAGVKPVPDRPVVRFIATVVLLGAAGAGISWMGLPDVFAPYVIASCGLLILAVVYGDGPGRLRAALQSVR